MDNEVYISDSMLNMDTSVQAERVPLVDLEKVRVALYSFTKRVFDIIVALFGLILLIPIALFVKIAYILNGDYYSIFYTQARIGKNGKLFKLYKFRTMVPNADEILFKYLEENEDAAKEYKINKKLSNDPRITKVGKFIRKFSLDEFPQIINVFRSDMHLIGNRPYLPREIEDMSVYYEDIIKTTPGITGYWQVNGRSNTTFEKRLELESYYSNNNSLKMDIKIFLKTFSIVFKGIGAK